MLARFPAYSGHLDFRSISQWNCLRADNRNNLHNYITDKRWHYCRARGVLLYLWRLCFRFAEKECAMCFDFNSNAKEFDWIYRSRFVKCVNKKFNLEFCVILFSKKVLLDLIRIIGSGINLINFVFAGIDICSPEIVFITLRQSFSEIFCVGSFTASRNFLNLKASKLLQSVWKEIDIYKLCLAHHVN